MGQDYTKTSPSSHCTDDGLCFGWWWDKTIQRPHLLHIARMTVFVLVGGGTRLYKDLTFFTLHGGRSTLFRVRRSTLTRCPAVSRRRVVTLPVPGPGAVTSAGDGAGTPPAPITPVSVYTYNDNSVNSNIFTMICYHYNYLSPLNKSDVAYHSLSG